MPQGPKQKSLQIKPNMTQDNDLESIRAIQRPSVIVNGSNINQLQNPLETLSHQDSLPVKKKIVRISPSVTKVEYLMEAITLGLNIFTWVYFFQNYGNIPNVVSVDFQLNTFEKVDKQYFFIILLADLVQYFLLSILQLTTHKFKYVQELKETTAPRIFLYTRYFIESYKLNTTALITYTTICIFNIVQNTWNPDNIFVLVVFIFAYCLFGAVYYIKLNDLNNVFKY